jgi:hypothetical protein
MQLLVNGRNAGSKCKPFLERPHASRFGSDRSWGSGAAAAAPDKHVLVKPSDNRIRRNADRYVSMVVIGIVDVSPRRLNVEEFHARLGAR